MSLSQGADIYERPKEYAVHNRIEYGFILALICIALVLVVASARFTPAPVGSEISSEISLVGP
jgi:hypothetical protein